MTKTYPYYKVVISYFNIADDDSEHTESIIVFQEEKPIDSRKKAIERFRSLEDIFEDGIKNGTVLKSVMETFKNKITTATIPSLNLYFCENDDADDDLVLYGSLLENWEERFEELTDEYAYYLKNGLETDGVELHTDLDGDTYIILENSLLNQNDLEYFKSNN